MMRGRSFNGGCSHQNDAARLEHHLGRRDGNPGCLLGPLVSGDDLVESLVDDRHAKRLAGLNPIVELGQQFLRYIGVDTLTIWVQQRDGDAMIAGRLIEQEKHEDGRHEQIDSQPAEQLLQPGFLLLAMVFRLFQHVLTNSTRYGILSCPEGPT
jgi:hypothetical protein